MEYTKIPHLSFSLDMHNILNSSDYEHASKQQLCCLLLMKKMENVLFQMSVLQKNKDKFIKPRHIRMIFSCILLVKPFLPLHQFCQCLDPAFIILCKTSMVKAQPIMPLMYNGRYDQW